MPRKLKLEDLEVTSFDTAPIASARGTVDGHAKPTVIQSCRCEPTDPAMDCTYGCSINTNCPNTCIIMGIEPVIE
jgi:hypothetical protein